MTWRSNRISQSGTLGTVSAMSYERKVIPGKMAPFFPPHPPELDVELLNPRITDRYF
ncbi:hypothetical protein SCLCIDRAFT_1210219 [Scleroderma citrinum Foug A]|uniref:Uncharacterized protein n=1 Tax=Scleroderma citrinum Foug A TaxID=1036808 RepID=A0A0C3EH08_9AGAM|nr:hypothetical protein SCLCIDRAFT_1210219 [Scleroderma citrinum Foug A]